jgi:hypothetical protein
MRKPKLEKQLRDAVDLYSTDDLRRVYQLESNEGIQLRGGIILRNELRAEILWRLWCDRWISRATLIAAVVGAAAGIIAVVEGWPK